MSKQEARAERINEWLEHLHRWEATGGSLLFRQMTAFSWNTPRHVSREVGVRMASTLLKSGAGTDTRIR